MSTVDFRSMKLSTSRVRDAHLIDRLLVCTLIELSYPDLRRTLNEILDTVQREGLEDAWEFWDQFRARLDELACAFGK